MARHSTVKKVKNTSLKKGEIKKSKVGNIGQQGSKSEFSMGKESESHKKLVKLAEHLVMSHPELSFHKALQIEKQRQEAKKKRDEDGTVAVWNNMSIEEDLEQYMKEFDGIENLNVQEIEECVEEILELEIFGEEKENGNADSGKRQGALRMRDVNSNIQKE